MPKETGSNLFAQAKAKSKAIDSPPGAKVEGVNVNTYPSLAKAFMDSRGGKGFLIVERYRNIKGEVHHATVDEWGAWVAYFFRKGIKTHLMEQQGYRTVPAQWPHEFDVDASPEHDYEAAQHHRKNMQRRIAEQHETRVAPVELGRRIQSIWAAIKPKMIAKAEQEEGKKEPPPPRVYTDEEMRASAERIQKFNRSRML